VIWRGKVSLITITSSSPPLKKCPRLSLACPFLLVSLDADIAEGNTKKKNIAAQYSSRVSAMLMLSVILIF
jgi:hypothetical protein